MKMKTIFVFIIVMFIFQLLICDEFPKINQDQSWTLSYDNPVDLAIEIMDRTPLFWNTVGYHIILAQVNIGYNAVQFGGAYIILESPQIAFDLVTGGFYKALGSVSYDFILDVIEKCVRTPQVLCRGIAKTMMYEGLNDYKKAYKIAKNYEETNNLSYQDAIKFLEYRWGVFKMSNANALQARARNEDYQFEKIVAEIASNEMLTKFEDEYRIYMNQQNTIPVIEGCKFVRDVYDILEYRKLGLANYSPYLDFTNNIKDINEIIMSEKRRFGNFSSSNSLGFNSLDYLPLSVGKSWNYVYSDGSESGWNYLRKNIKKKDNYSIRIMYRLEIEINMSNIIKSAEVFMVNNNSLIIQELGKTLNITNPNSILRIDKDIYLSRYIDNKISDMKCLLSPEKTIFLSNTVSGKKIIPSNYIYNPDFLDVHLNESNLEVKAFLDGEFSGEYIIFSKGIGIVRIMNWSAGYDSGYILVE